MQDANKTDRELSHADLDIVAGGLNPQPLPPSPPPSENSRSARSRS